ncbi:hypothetical protein PXJ20_07455 [Paraburkholderia sp. A1RI_3L]|uniref:hypothetical protein n=1 Tax=Paraburkholderia TaxID=1822464 RepID=UPI0024086945|nr:hypothetical protein [Paraburkholderia sp. SUR17]WEY37927.1 hypothetical protein P2869_12745 [Paraburkholderia sp. SUR17]
MRLVDCVERCIARRAPLVLAASLALLFAASSASAQEAAAIASPDPAVATLVDTPSAAVTPSQTVAQADTGRAPTTAAILFTRAMAVPGATTLSDIPLDDQVLSRQRGGAVGMMMVAATPQLMRGNGVTLWDEIAPPAPLPIPVDAARAAQSNVTTYQRNGN